MTITFDNGTILQAKSAHIINDGFAEGIAVDIENAKPELYEIFGIKSIIPDQKVQAPSDLQTQFTNYLQNTGYVWDKQHSAASAGVVLRRADGEFLFRDFWFFGMEGEIMHNPDGITIKL